MSTTYLRRKEPNNSCPNTDSIISDLETVRQINKDLREWAEDCLAEVDSIEEENESLQKQIRDLEDKIDHLENDLYEYRSKQ